MVLSTEPLSRHRYVEMLETADVGIALYNTNHADGYSARAGECFEWCLNLDNHLLALMPRFDQLTGVAQ